MENKGLRPATWAWFGLAAYITLADAALIAGERKGWDRYCTMSTAFKEALGSPVRRWQLILLWATITLHLFPILVPEKIQPYEPMGFIGRKLSNVIFRPQHRQDNCE